MTKIQRAVLRNTGQIADLLKRLRPADYESGTVGPYYSSIGQHIRHVLDIYSLALGGIEKGETDLTRRPRNPAVERDPAAARRYLAEVEARLRALTPGSLEKPVRVTDDNGAGPLECEYSGTGLLCQAVSHSIHHSAVVGYLLHHLGIPSPAGGFGWNPTSPQKATS